MDDSLLFYQASHSKNEFLRQSLDIYELASDQQLNWEKNEMLFSLNVGMEEVDAIISIWNISSLQSHDRYWDFLLLGGNQIYAC